jgi:UDP-N-acetylmuramate--alanine ligase
MKIHFIGIGGIGISALAQYYLAQGAEVFGSDLYNSEMIELLKEKGAHIKIGPHKRENVMNDTDLVIYTPAIPSNNSEFQKAKELKIACPAGRSSGRTGENCKLKIESYPKALGELTKKYFTIAVSGMHGKSTITSMIALMMEKAGLDPTVILGTKLKEFGNTNFRMGSQQSKVPGQKSFLLIEADEYDASFLNYRPKIVVLANIEEEHLDYYKNLENIFDTFIRYVNQLPEDGKLIINGDDKNINKLKSRFNVKQENIFSYSLSLSEAKEIKNILKIPGEHNISNALSVLQLGRVLGISKNIIYEALSGYQGSWRRFEVLCAELRGISRGTTRKITIIYDYAHHPTEIKATLFAAREKWPNKKIWVVYQPHQYQRTYYFFDRFVEVFFQAPVDKIIFIPVFDVVGREDSAIKEKVNSQKLAEAVNQQIFRKKPGKDFAPANSANPVIPSAPVIPAKSVPDPDRGAGIQRKEVIYLEGIDKAKQYLEDNLQGGEAVFIMGAGDIYKLKLLDDSKTSSRRSKASE